MADHNRDPSLGSSTDDQTKNSSEPTPKADMLDRTWTTKLEDSEVPHVGDSIVYTPTEPEDVSTLQRAELEGGNTEDTEPGVSESGETIVQSEDTGVKESGTPGSSESEIIPVSQQPNDLFIPYASHAILSENLLAFRRSMQDPESFRAWSYELHGLLAIPSSESPLERFLTPNWVEDANNLYARIHMRDLEVNWEGLSLVGTRRSIARALVRQTTESARRAPSSYASASLEQEPRPDDEAPRQ